MPRTTNHAGEAVEAADVAEALRVAAASCYQQGRAKAQKAVEYTQGVVKERPLQSVMIAAGIGFALGMLWSRNRS